MDTLKWLSLGLMTMAFAFIAGIMFARRRRETDMKVTVLRAA